MQLREDFLDERRRRRDQLILLEIDAMALRRRPERDRDASLGGCFAQELRERIEQRLLALALQQWIEARLVNHIARDELERSLHQCELSRTARHQHAAALDPLSRAQFRHRCTMQFDVDMELLAAARQCARGGDGGIDEARCFDACSLRDRTQQTQLFEFHGRGNEHSRRRPRGLPAEKLPQMEICEVRVRARAGNTFEVRARRQLVPEVMIHLGGLYARHCARRCAEDGPLSSSSA